MLDNNFRNEQITITRDEIASLMATKIANLHISVLDETVGQEIDTELLDMIDEMFLRFSADVITALFDEGKLGELEIDKED